ncbi:MAG: peptidoglycan DD-metalloendopeptidase family protein [Thermanaerothrix sp.]|nr:peptidoglycan DD-metalloendopeptidase family protein [Thermanaerothrix sp.]
MRLRFFSLIIILVSLLYPWGYRDKVWAQNEDLPVYIVQPNDTINSIARRFGVSPQDLIQTNQIENPDVISVGTPLRIPGFEGVRGTLTTVSVPLGASLSSLSRQHHIPEDQIVRLNRLATPSQLFVGATLILPMQEDNSSKSQTTPLVTLSVGQTPLELATASGVSLWDYLLVNGVESSAQLLPLDPLIAVGDEQLAQNVAAFPGAPAFVKGIDLYPLPVVQGKTVVVKVSANQPVRVSGMLGEWPLHFDAQDANTYVALQGIHAMAQPGLLDFSLALTTAEGTSFSLNQPVLLQPGNYPQDPPLFVDPQTLDKANTEPEDNLVRSVVANHTPVKYWQGVFRKPVDEPSCIKSWFGNRRSYNNSGYTYFHTGVDYGVCANLNIYAPAAGVVVFTGPLTVRGNATIIDHGWGVYSGFWHQSSILVQVGDRVEAGQLIGEIGGTGRVTGPHLHWEVWVNGVQVEPLDWLEREYP